MNTMIAMGKEVTNINYKSRSKVDVNERGSTLIKESAKEGDSGQYKCTVGSGVKPETIIHRVSVLLAPAIVSVNGAEADLITAQQGDDVKLTCEATGTPTPTLLWSKKDNDLS